MEIIQLHAMLLGASHARNVIFEMNQDFSQPLIILDGRKERGAGALERA